MAGGKSSQLADDRQTDMVSLISLAVRFSLDVQYDKLGTFSARSGGLSVTCIVSTCSIRRECVLLPPHGRSVTDFQPTKSFQICFFYTWKKSRLTFILLPPLSLSFARPRVPVKCVLQVRVVKSAKDRSFEAIRTSVGKIRTTMKINDWNGIQANFDECNKHVDKSKVF